MSDEVLCENLFHRLASEDPNRLVAMLRRAGPLRKEWPLPANLLTFAAEIAGNALPSMLVAPPLIGLLIHPESVVREGAILGLANHRWPVLVTVMRDVIRYDKSDAVRTCAQGWLDAWEREHP